MVTTAAIVAALFGLLIGSFLNACIYRLPRDITLWNPSRSFCPSCEKTIAWYDNIPVVSFLLLGGKCRNCGYRIPVRYFLVEILCGVMYFVIVFQFGATVLAFKLMLFAAINLALIFSDLEERILPDEFTKGGIILGLVFSWFVWLQPGLPSLLAPDGTSPAFRSVVESAAAALFAYSSFGLMSYLFRRIRGREGMGMGDWKMAAMMGAFLGLMPMLLAIMVGSVLGSLIGLAYLAVSKQKASEYELPFGSFLGVGALAVGYLETLRSITDAVVH